ncbi:glycosyltransferase [Sphingobacterium mizutaii]|uniref:glycosyltransferase n=1 Tax=Sphingobacterium mizutaii TaxID=1010 RepID=UPI00289AE5CE|nr:glycosyltransferase [Sphingobacterium mizutaii]
MTKNNTVIFFVNSLQSGGIENYLLRFIEEFSHEFLRITVVCKSGFAGQLENNYSQFPNVEIVKLRIGFFSLFDYIKVNNLFRGGHYSAVCDFTGNFSGIILLLAKLNSINTRIAFYRNSENRFKNSTFKNWFNNLMRNLTIKFSTRILTNSKAALKFYFNSIYENNKKFKVIYNGINSEKFLKEEHDLRKEFNLPDNAFVVGHVGRYNPAKNHETIIKVAEILIKKHPNIFFLLTGNGVEKNLKPKTDELGLSKRIILSENRNDIAKVLKTIDCFYFPSITEGQPNALLEAMVSGVPIVASNIEPIKECSPITFHDQLVPPTDFLVAVERIEEIYKGKFDFDLSVWVLNEFNHEKLFSQFYNELKNESFICK